MFHFGFFLFCLQLLYQLAILLLFEININGIVVTHTHNTTQNKPSHNLHIFFFARNNIHMSVWYSLSDLVCVNCVAVYIERGLKRSTKLILWRVRGGKGGRAGNYWFVGWLVGWLVPHLVSNVRVTIQINLA